MKVLRQLLLLCTALTVLAACKEIESKFSITWPSSDKYTVETVSEAVPGDNITVKVTAASEDIIVSSVKFNSEEAKLESSEGTVTTWSFVMPSSDVTLEITAEQNPSFPITWNECDSYTIEAPSEAKANEEVTVTITPGEQVEIKGLKYNDDDCTLVSSEGGKSVFSFTMPAQAVALTVDYTAPAKTYTITADNQDGVYSFSVAKSAEEGSLVKFTMTFVDQTRKVTAVSFGSGETCTLLGETVEEEFTTYEFEFTMPSRNVTLNPTVEKNWHRIYRVSSEHAEVKALNCLVKDEQGNPIPDEDGSWICQQIKGQMFHFIVYPEIGYNYEITVKGESGKGYGYGPATAPDFGACLGVQMPNEPITVEATSSEKEDYLGEPFVGTYNGCFIDILEASKISSCASANAVVELKANTVFTVKTTDANAFDFKGTYTYDKSAGSFKYNYEDCDAYGLSGKTGEKFNLFIVNNKVEDMPEHTRFYIVSKEEASDFVCASNASKNEALIQVNCAGKNEHYFFTRSSYSISPVEVTFESGSSIADAGAVAFFTDEVSGTSYRYSVEGGKAVFTKGGKEAGAYAPAAGSEADLVLDGFGKGTYKGEEGTYTVDGTIVKFTSASGETSFILNFTDKTYTIVGGEGGWDGPVEYYIEGEFGINNDRSRNASVSIKLDVANEQATFIVRIGNDYNELENAIYDVQGFSYDSEAGTLTITQVYAGTGQPWDSKRRDFVLTVSPDKSELRFRDDEYVYSTGSHKKYIVVKDLAIPAL